MNTLNESSLICNTVDKIPSPEVLRVKLPLASHSARTVLQGRKDLYDILNRNNDRMFVIVGPCSIHDPNAGLDYARKLHVLQNKVSDVLLLVMRVYFEKPRTKLGWKGFVNDPEMNGSCCIEKGVELARKFMINVVDIGLPTATEALNPILSQYFEDLVSWTAIGARTTESQLHRELSSGLATPVGFKNGTDGNVDIAINAILAASHAHTFLGNTQRGQIAIITTRGNSYGHLVLRGGGGRPNYDSVSVQLAEQALSSVGLPTNIVVDCSHGNTGNNYELQPQVLADVMSQVLRGRRSIVGVMFESNLVQGKQTIASDLSKLVYGCSVTDGCVGWDLTERMILDAADALRAANTTRPSIKRKRPAVPPSKARLH